MEQFLNKKYKLSQSENFEEFMKAAGIGFMARKIVGLLSPTVLLKKEDDFYFFVTLSTFRTMELKFKLGEEFDDVKPDGTIWKSVCTIEGNKLIQVQKGLGREIRTVREFTPTELTVVMTVGDVVAKRIHTLVED